MIYSIDLNAKNNLAINLIHSTSSGKKNEILSQGIVPFDDLNAELTQYIKTIFPNQNPTKLLKLITSKSVDDYYRLLIEPRLNKSIPNSNAVYLLPVDSYDYLNSAASNSVEDGGEIFRVAREAVNQVLKLNRSGFYAGAVPIVLLCSFELQRSPNGFKLINSNLPEVTLNNPPPKNIEIKYFGTVQPQNIKCFFLDEYIGLEKKYIHPAAKKFFI